MAQAVSGGRNAARDMFEADAAAPGGPVTVAEFRGRSRMIQREDEAI
jgi:hypothetical protein